MDSRRTKKLLFEANRQLEMAQSTNRDLRVKILFDEKASKRTHERLLREAQQGLPVSVEAGDAANELLKLKVCVVVVVVVVVDCGIVHG